MEKIAELILAHLLGGFTEMSFEGFKIHEVSVLGMRAETTKLHVFEHFVMKVRQKNHSPLKMILIILKEKVEIVWKLIL